MNPSLPLRSHRFVVVYRAETREIRDASEIWRGWIESVPDPRDSDEDAVPQRLGFQSLEDLPRLIDTLIRRQGGPA